MQRFPACHLFKPPSALSRALHCYRAKSFTGRVDGGFVHNPQSLADVALLPATKSQRRASARSRATPRIGDQRRTPRAPDPLPSLSASRNSFSPSSKFLRRTCIIPNRAMASRCGDFKPLWKTHHFGLISGDDLAVVAQYPFPCGLCVAELCSLTERPSPLRTLLSIPLPRDNKPSLKARERETGLQLFVLLVPEWQVLEPRPVECVRLQSLARPTAQTLQPNRGRLPSSDRQRRAANPAAHRLRRNRSTQFIDARRVT